MIFFGGSNSVSRGGSIPVSAKGLAGLNAPERETKKGKEAALFVRDQLAKARGIVVKTEKVDTFGRFIGHVFYSFEDDEMGAVYAEGRYLNDDLLKKGYAQRM